MRVEAIGSAGIIASSFRDVEVAKLQAPTPRISQQHENRYFRDEVPLIQDIVTKVRLSPIEVQEISIILGRSRTNDDEARSIIKQAVMITHYDSSGRLSEQLLATGILVDFRI